MDNSNIIQTLYKVGSKIKETYGSRSFLLEHERAQLKKACERWKESVLGFIDSYPQSESRYSTYRRFEVLFKSLEAFDYSLDWIGTILKELLNLDEMIAAPSPAPQSTGDDTGNQPISKKVFIVHGHNDHIKEKVARTLMALGLTPVILHEQTDNGRTIIEKFEGNSNDVGFAVVLLTADDLGKPKSSAEECSKRARQNVIFEMGYFMGTLKRSHVFLLLEEGVEEPSDIKGIIYKSLDKEGAWARNLVRELQSCGYNVSADNLP